MSRPARQATEPPNEAVRIGSEAVNGTVKTVPVSANFSDWGSHPRATVHTNEKDPGGIVLIGVQTRFGQRSVTIQGKLADFHVLTEWTWRTSS